MADQASSATATRKSYVSIAEKLEGARQYKDEGNAHFKIGNYKKAIISYNTVMAFTRGLPGSKRVSGTRPDSTDASIDTALKSQTRQGPAENWVTPQEEEAALDLESQSLSNLASCYLKLGKNSNAQDAAKKAIGLRPKSWKAFLRLAEAQSNTKEFDESKTSYKQAYNLVPENEVSIKNSIANAINNLKTQKKNYELELRKETVSVFGKVFGGRVSGDEIGVDNA